MAELVAEQLVERAAKAGVGAAAPYRPLLLGVRLLLDVAHQSAGE